MHDLGEAICELTAELREAREERRRGLATKGDLREMEKRLIAAIGGGVSESDRALLNAYLVRIGETVKKLEALDAQTPSE